MALPARQGAGAGFAGEALINTNNRTAKDPKGLLQDINSNAYTWMPESQEGLNAILQDTEILAQINAGKCFFYQHRELPAAIAVIHNQLPSEFTAYSDSSLIESEAIKLVRKSNSDKVGVAANKAGGGGRLPNNINFCGGGVMLLIGRLVCQGKGRHVGSSSGSGSGSSAAGLGHFEQMERLLSRGEVHGGRAKRQKTARAAPSEPPS